MSNHYIDIPDGKKREFFSGMFGRITSLVASVRDVATLSVPQECDIV